MNDIDRKSKLSGDTSFKSIRKNSTTRKKLLVAALTLLGLLVFAPHIAALTFVPGLIHTALKTHVRGDVDVSGVRLSWLGSQRITGIRIASNEDDTELQLAVDIDRSLLNLIFDFQDLGVIRLDVSGRGAVGDDGVMTFSQLFTTSSQQASNDDEVFPLDQNVVVESEPSAETQSVLPRGIAAAIDLTISNLYVTMPPERTDIEILNAQLKGSIVSSGRVVVNLVDMPVSILGLYADSSQVAIAALGETISGSGVLNPLDGGELEVTLNIESPYARVDLPQAVFDGTRLFIPRLEPVRGDLDISKKLSTEILSVLHPIFASIETTQRPIEVLVGPVEGMVDSVPQSMNAYGELVIGEVMLSSTALGSQMLSMIEGRPAAQLAARFGPLQLTMANGRIGYSDFMVDVGRRDDGSYVQSFVFSGEIDLGSDPPRVIAISASYPGSNLVSFFSELKSVPPVLLDTLRPTVTFYGPLFDGEGNRIPLKNRIEPFDIESTLRPDNVRNILKGVGELLQR